MRGFGWVDHYVCVGATSTAGMSILIAIADRLESIAIQIDQGPPISIAIVPIG